MKIASLLILWLLPALPAGAHAHSPCGRCLAGVPHARGHHRVFVIERAEKVSPSDELGIGSLFENEEDSLEDGIPADGLLLSRLWRSLGQGDYNPLCSWPRSLLRRPPLPTPLRC